MSRVKWKGPYVESKLLKKIQNATVVSKNDIKTISRSSVILPKFIGLTVRVHNGKTFVIVKIVDEMVGYKLGEFVLTRKQFSFKKKKNNKK